MFSISLAYRELDSISLWADGDLELSMLPPSDEDELDELLSLLELECDDKSDLSESLLSLLKTVCVLDKPTTGLSVDVAHSTRKSVL